MNIFARELVLVLGSHKKELGSLFSLRVHDPYTGVDRQIVPSKITRLKRSLTENITATLNAEELDALQTFVPLDRDGKELRRLRAALVAEAVRSLLAGRIDGKQANNLGDIVLALMLEHDAQQMVALRNELLKSATGVRRHGDQEMILRGARDVHEPAPGSPEERIEQALDAGAEAYSQGTLWLEVARETAADDPTRVGYAALAEKLFREARDLIRDAAMVAQGASQQRDWLAAIDAALAGAANIH